MFVVSSPVRLESVLISDVLLHQLSDSILFERKDSTTDFTAECAMCATTHRECSRCQLNMTFRTVVAFQLQCRMGYPLQRSDVSIATINNNGGK